MHRSVTHILFFIIFAFILIGGFASFISELILPLTACGIKGNISQDRKEKIYHLPHTAHYKKIRIDLRRGERWFCSEKSAQKAGWKKSKPPHGPLI